MQLRSRSAISLLLSGFALCFLVLASGCLQDPITGPEVFSRVVTAPQHLRVYSPPASWNHDNSQTGARGDMVIRWNHSRTDTQLNFKSYYIRLFHHVAGTADSGVLIKTLQVLKSGNIIDTSITLPNMPYDSISVKISGVQFADSLILSSDTTELYPNHVLLFDPRWLDNPTNVQATSSLQYQVRLHWTLPASDTISGLKGYQVYYRDPALGIADTGHAIGDGLIPRGETYALLPAITIPPTANISNPLQEHAFIFWVKAVRSDSVQFTQDSSVITWSGAERLGAVQPTSVDSVSTTVDSSKIFAHSIRIGSFNGADAITDDSSGNGNLNISISGSTLTLTPVNGVKVLNHIDYAYSLDSIFYTKPYIDGSPMPAGYAFTSDPVTLSSGSPNSAILYISIPDNRMGFENQPFYARVFIPKQADGSYILLSRFVSAITSYQPGVAFGGHPHLPYY